MLQKQNISIPTNSQLDTKSDPFLTDAQSALTQENVRFYQAGALVKRPGFSLVGNAASYNGKRLITDNKQLFISSPSAEVYQYQDGWSLVNPLGTFLDQGAGQVQCGLEFSSGTSSDTYLINCDSYGTLSILAYASSDGTYLVINNDGNIKKVLIRSYAAAPRGLVARILLSSGTPVIAVIDTLPTTIANTYSINGDLITTNSSISSGRQVHATVLSDRSALICYNGVLANDEIVTLTAAGVVTIQATAAYTTTTNFSDSISNGTKLWLATAYDGTVNATVRQLDVATGALDWTATQALVTTIGSDNPGRVGIADSGTTVTVAVSCLDSTAGVTKTKLFTVLKAAPNTVTDILDEAWHILAAKPIIYDSETYLPLIGGASSEPTDESNGIYSGSLVLAKVVSGTLQTVSNAMYAQALSSYNFTSGSSRYAISDVAPNGDRFYIAARRSVGSGVNLDNTTTLFGSCDLFYFNLANSETQYGKELVSGESLIEYGGCAKFVDGLLSAPVSFHFAPVISLTGSTSGGSMLAGAYAYSAIFERYDDVAGVTRSAESNIPTVTTTGSTSSVLISVRVCRQVAGATLNIYRTAANGSTRRLVATQKLQGSTGNIFTFTDTKADSSIPSASEIVYTTGGVLSHRPPPPALNACVHNNRVFIVAADENDTIYYSNKSLKGEVTSFSDLLFLEQFSSGRYSDKITGVSSVGDKLIIFRENSIYWVAGDGANELGVEQSFTEPELLSDDIGCTNSRSIISTPVGVLFKSAKGIYQIDAGLSMNYVGAAVESFNSEAIIDTTLNTDRNIVVMATASRVLTFDYLLQRWSVDTLAGVRAVGIWKNDVIALLSTGQVVRESALFQDNLTGTPANIQMKLVTGWMKLTGIQDYGRTWRVLVLGRWKSSHTLTVKAYYDYDDSTVETYTITASSTPGLYQYNIHLKRQKCEALKLELFDTGSGQSLDLVSLTLEVGVKKGTMKVPAVRKL